jgi:hypothetical protein
VQQLTPSKRGAIAEAEVTAAAIRLDLLVLRPLSEGGRYDLGIDIGHRILRVQCKWTRLRSGIFTARCITSRHTPQGYVRTTYSGDEVDAIAVYVSDVDECYLIPITEAAGRSSLSLRLEPTGNNQAMHVRWARHYEFAASIRRNWPPDPPVQSAPSRGARMSSSGL